MLEWTNFPKVWTIQVRLELYFQLSFDLFVQENKIDCANLYTVVPMFRGQSAYGGRSFVSALRIADST